MAAPLALELLPEALAVCRLAADAPLPAWAGGPGLCSVTRTADELSIICAAGRIPGGITTSAGWRALRLAGTFDLAEVGVLLRVAAPLAAAGVSLLPVGTWDTDYVLVREAQLEQAVEALQRAGLEVRREARREAGREG